MSIIATETASSKGAPARSEDEVSVEVGAPTEGGEVKVEADEVDAKAVVVEVKGEVGVEAYASSVIMNASSEM